MFKQGDIVKSEWTTRRGKVLYGPFEYGGNVIGDRQYYLVELLEGEKKGITVQWPAQAISPAPRFQEGQVVRARYLTTGLAKVAAGPFKGEKCQWYVLELPEGRHSTEIEDDLTPVVE